MDWLYWAIPAAVVGLFLLPTMAVAGIIYTVLLVRTSKKKWDRSCSIPTDEEYCRMFDIGIEWDKQYGACKHPVEIVSDGFRLAGEYFDFGAKKAVIIIPGRMESLLYSYFFAEPFRVGGCNVLVIDNRSHGLSEGRVVSLGFREYRDILGWSKLLHDELGNEAVILHGICIGAEVAVFALTSKDCPDYLRGMVAEGMFTNFYQSFRNHMIDGCHPLFPLAGEVMLLTRIFSHARAVTDGPLKRIPGLKKPILFLHSREDIFSVPAQADALYAACGSEQKKLVWFPVGAHSRIRINDAEAYDRAIVDYLPVFETEGVPVA